MTEREIFIAALQYDDPSTRAAFLDQACSGESSRRERIELLLRAHEKAADFLDLPSDASRVTIELPAISEGPGTVIGRYRLLQQIGKGGFGVVYMAEQQEPVRRKVALKIIKPGMDSREVIARFEAERQALAMMDHPNIARVYDAGATITGRPYFVMELVRGLPITEYCDRNILAADERLELFISTCQAVQHAHLKGIIHRDIKPTNVLVTLHDGKPVVKVIDFGVAKAIDHRLTDKTLFTQFATMVGTPLYMSPEQAEMSGLDVDTRTDIYSLGVLLYELLTGTTPFDKERLYKAGYDEIRRIIREEEPSKPSTKVSTLGNTANAISSNRKSDPKKLSAILKGDLDWVVMKALEKDRTRRYETAKDFADDVRRYFMHEPVEARSPSSLYRLRKLVRRHRATAASISVALPALIGAAVFCTAMWINAHRAHMNSLAATQTCIDALVKAGDFSTAERVGHALFDTYLAKFGWKDERTSQAAVCLAKALAGLKRWDDSVRTLEEASAAQASLLGKDSPTTRKTCRAFAELCCDIARKLSISPSSRRQDYELASKLADRCVRLDADVPDGKVTQALARYRLGDHQAAIDILSTTMEDHSWSERVWWLLSMSYWKLGNHEAARDCYAICNYGSTSDTEFQGIRAEATRLLRIDEWWKTEEWTAARIIDSCSNLLKEYPRSYFLYLRRSTSHAGLGHWRQAATDLDRALEIRPQPRFIVDEARVAFLLAARDAPNASIVCRETFEQFRRQTAPTDQLRAAMLCCLVPSARVTLTDLTQCVSEAESRGADASEVALLRGMIAFRSGRYKEADELLPVYDFAEVVTPMTVFTDRDYVSPGRWKAHVLSLAYRAMANYRLGRRDKADQLLSEVRNYCPQELPVVLSKWPASNRYLAATWCLARAAVEETEALIGHRENRPSNSVNLKGGDDHQRVELDAIKPAVLPMAGDDLHGLKEAIRKLEQNNVRKAQLVKLRYFAGPTTAGVAETLGVSVSAAENDWACARPWLRPEMLGAR